jgi:hypothetical protein
MIAQFGNLDVETKTSVIVATPNPTKGLFSKLTLLVGDRVGGGVGGKREP